MLNNTQRSHGHGISYNTGATHPIWLTFRSQELEKEYCRFVYETSGFYGGRIWHCVAVLINLVILVWYRGMRVGWNFSSQMFNELTVALFASTVSAVVIGAALLIPKLAAWRELLFLTSLTAHWPSFTVAAYFGLGPPWVYSVGICVGCLFFCTFVVQARFHRVLWIILIVPILTLALTTTLLPAQYFTLHKHMEIIFWTVGLFPLGFLVYFEKQSRKNFVRMSNCMKEIADVSRRTQGTRDLVVNFFARTPCEDFLLDGKKVARAHTYPDCAMIVTDIAGFTAWTSETPQTTVISTLSKMFAFIDEKSAHYNVEKISTVGDCFIGAIFPCERPVEERCCDMHHFACGIIHSAEKLELRVGTHIGTVVAGFIGSMPPKFDIFGPDVAIAKHMEHDGVKGNCHSSFKMLEIASSCGKPFAAVDTELGKVFPQWERTCNRNTEIDIVEFTEHERVKICQALITIGQERKEKEKATETAQVEGQRQTDSPTFVYGFGDATPLNSTINNGLNGSTNAYEALWMQNSDSIGGSVESFSHQESSGDPDSFERLPSMGNNRNGMAGIPQISIVSSDGVETTIDTRPPTTSPSTYSRAPVGSILGAPAPNHQSVPSAIAAASRSPKVNVGFSDELASVPEQVLLSPASASTHLSLNPGPNDENSKAGKMKDSKHSKKLKYQRPQDMDVATLVETASKASISQMGSDMHSFFSRASEMESHLELNKILLKFNHEEHEELYGKFIHRTGLLKNTEFSILLVSSFFVVAQMLVCDLSSDQNRLLYAGSLIVICSYFTVSKVGIRFQYHRLYMLLNFELICIFMTFQSVPDNYQSKFYAGAVTSNTYQVLFLASQFMLDIRMMTRFALLLVAAVNAYALSGIRWLVFRDDVLPWDVVYLVGVVGWGFVSYFADFSLRSAYAADEKLKLSLRTSRGRHQVLAARALDVMLPPFVSHRLLGSRDPLEDLDADAGDEEGGNDKLFDTEGLAGEDTLWNFDSACVVFISFDPHLGDENHDFIDIINKAFSEIEEILSSGQIHKIKTSGLTLLAVSGINDEKDHIPVTLRAALEIQSKVFGKAGREGWDFSIGVNNGPIMGAVLGRSAMIFDVFGDTVNLASRMQSTAVNKHIQVSKSIRDAIGLGNQTLSLKLNPPVVVKGKGTLETYDLTVRETREKERLPAAART